MIIGIDGNEANVEKKVGISEYAYELLMQFSYWSFHNSQTQFVIYLKQNPRSDLPVSSKNWSYKVVKPSPLWTQFGLPLYLYTHIQKPDVFFSLTHYAPRFSPVPTVVSLMDVSYLHFPDLFKKKDLYQLVNWTKYSLEHASKVITISNATKNDIIKYYNVLEKKIVVAYPGIKIISSMNVSNQDILKKEYNIDTNYLLFVGTLQPRKNLVRLMHAFQIVLQKRPELQLVVVGKKGWLYEEIIHTPEKLKIADHVKFLEYVTDSHLPFLYRNAQCFILPSLYEGFGLPVLEAMKYECPVITSNISSLPEAGGDAAVYVDPTNVLDIAQKIEMVLSDEKLRADMKEKGTIHVKQFSWEKSAQKILSEIEKITL